MTALALGASIVLAATSVVIVLTVSGTTAQVADNARNLHWTNSVLGSAAIVRAANNQAVFFAVDRAAGVASDEALNTAVAEAENALTTFTDVVAANPGEVSEQLSLAIDEFHIAASEVVERVKSGDSEVALEASVNAETEFSVVTSTLDILAVQVEARIADTEGTAGTVASVTEAVVTLLLPLAAFGLYRFIVRRQLHERRVEFEARLAAADELSRSKDNFIAGLSHEFRTPLTAIFGFSELLLEQGLVDPEFSSELIHLINAESAELSRMVEDLLMAARIEAGELTIQRSEVSIADEVETVVAPFRRAGAQLEVQVSASVVLTDGLRLRQVLRNLVSNAHKHGGSKLGVFGRESGGRYLLSVVDDGDGVPEGIAGRLFERFVHDGRNALLTGSVGLGLNIAQELAIAMGGDLFYERIGVSTVFTLVMPLDVATSPLELSPETASALV